MHPTTDAARARRLARLRNTAVLCGWLMLLPLLLYWHFFATRLPTEYTIHNGFLHWKVGSSHKRLDLKTGQIQDLSHPSLGFLLSPYEKDLITIQHDVEQNSWEVRYMDPVTMNVQHRRRLDYPPGNTFVAHRYLVSVLITQEGTSVLEVVDLLHEDALPMRSRWHGESSPKFTSIPGSASFFHCSVSGEVYLYAIDSDQVREMATWNTNSKGGGNLLCDAQRIISLNPDRTQFECRSTHHGSLLEVVSNPLGLGLEEYGAVRNPSISHNPAIHSISPSGELGLHFSIKPDREAEVSHFEIYDLRQGVLRHSLRLPFQATTDRWNNSCFLSESTVVIRGRAPDGQVAVMDIETGNAAYVYRPEYWRCVSWPWVAWSLLFWISGWLLLSADRIGSAWLDVAMLVGFVMFVSASTTIGPWIQICLMLGLVQFAVWWTMTSSEPSRNRVWKGVGLTVLALGIGESSMGLEFPLFASPAAGRGTLLLMAAMLGSYSALLGMGVRLWGSVYVHLKILLSQADSPIATFRSVASSIG